MSYQGLEASQVSFDGTYFQAPYEKPEYPEIIDGFIPSNTEVHFELIAHSQVEHLDTTKARLPESDIYLPENIYWTDPELKIFRAISKGNGQLLQKTLAKYPGMTGFQSETLRMIQGTYKAIGFIDLSSADHPNQDMLRAAQATVPEAAGNATTDELLLDGFISKYNLAKTQEYRDAEIIANLGPLVTKLVLDNPRLRAKDTVRVLSAFGSMHERLFTYLAGQSAMSDQISAAVWYEPGSFQKEHVGEDLELSDLITSGQPVHKSYILNAFYDAKVISILGEEELASTRSNHRQKALTVNFRKALLGRDAEKNMKVLMKPKKSLKEDEIYYITECYAEAIAVTNMQFPDSIAV